MKWETWLNTCSCHRRSQGVQWVHLHLQGGEKNLGIIYRENL